MTGSSTNGTRSQLLVLGARVILKCFDSKWFISLLCVSSRFMNSRVPPNKRYQPTEYEHAANCATHAVNAHTSTQTRTATVAVNLLRLTNEQVDIFRCALVLT